MIRLQDWERAQLVFPAYMVRREALLLCRKISGTYDIIVAEMARVVLRRDIAGVEEDHLEPRKCDVC